MGGGTMNSVQTLLTRCRGLGAEFTATIGGKLKVRAPTPLPKALWEELKCHKTEVLALLEQQRHPSINDRGELLIPLDSHPRYHWWAGGQSLYVTLCELDAPPAVIAKYVKPDRL